MEDNLDNLITDYLSDTLDPESRRNFEQRLAAEPELAAHVALERDLAVALDTSSPENQLRANLRHLSEKYDSPVSLDPRLGEGMGGKGRLGWVFVAAVLVLSGLVYWYLRPAEKPTMSLPPQPNLESPNTPAAQDLPKTNEGEKSKQDSKLQPIAAAFKPIAKLESYIGSHVRSGGLQMRVERPKSNETLSARSGKVAFRFSGKTEGSVADSQHFRMMILNNNLRNFEAMRAVETQPLQLSSNSNFLIEKKLALPPGLYYLLVEEQSSGEWMFVDKFLVKG